MNFILPVPEAFAGGGNLLGQIGTGAYDFHGGHTIIGSRKPPEQIADCGIFIDHLGNIIDELDDKFSHRVAGSSFAADQHTAFDPTVQIATFDGGSTDGSHAKYSVTGVCIRDFDLHIEQRGRIKRHPHSAWYQLRQPYLVSAFDRLPAVRKAASSA